jgi:3-phosphoshikimate 1-carboxyvinyltransferase
MLHMKVTSVRSLGGSVHVPGDKSISHRAAILAAMSEGVTRIRNFSTAEDCRTTLQCLRQLGVQIDASGNDTVITGAGKHGFSRPAGPLDCGNSGTTARLLAGLLAGQSFHCVLTGDASLSTRPMQRIVEPLTAMGASIESTDGHLPLRIAGGDLRPLAAPFPVMSAQVKSCLLIAGTYVNGETALIDSAATRDHTERMMQWLGADIELRRRSVRLRGGHLAARDIAVPGDISSAAFFVIAAACLPGCDIRLNGVGLNPTRTAFLDLVKAAGADINIENVEEVGNEPRGDLHIRGGLAGGEPLMITPDTVPKVIDELPVLAVLGTQLTDGIRIENAGELRHKETDRLSAMADNLRLMNADVEVYGDSMRVHPSALKGAVVDPRGDHRIAMALAVAGLLAEGETEIINAECVDISFPGFFDTLASVAR